MMNLVTVFRVLSEHINIMGDWLPDTHLFEANVRLHARQHESLNLHILMNLNEENFLRSNTMIYDTFLLNIEVCFYL